MSMGLRGSTKQLMMFKSINQSISKRMNAFLQKSLEVVCFHHFQSTLHWKFYPLQVKEIKVHTDCLCGKSQGIYKKKTKTKQNKN